MGIAKVPNEMPQKEKDLRVRLEQAIDSLGYELGTNNSQHTFAAYPAKIKKILETFFLKYKIIERGEFPHKDELVLHYLIENCTDECGIEELDDALDDWFAVEMVDKRYRFYDEENDVLEWQWKKRERNTSEWSGFTKFLTDGEFEDMKFLTDDEFEDMKESNKKWEYEKDESTERWRKNNPYELTASSRPRRTE